MGRTKVDLYQLDDQGAPNGYVITLVGGVPAWASDPNGMTNSKFIDEESPSGAVNSANVTFGLSSAAVTPQKVHVYLDGIRLMSGSANDYVLGIDNQTITMNYAPATGQNFFADYRVA